MHPVQEEIAREYFAKEYLDGLLTTIERQKDRIAELEERACNSGTCDCHVTELSPSMKIRGCKRLRFSDA